MSFWIKQNNGNSYVFDLSRTRQSVLQHEFIYTSSILWKYIKYCFQFFSIFNQHWKILINDIFDQSMKIKLKCRLIFMTILQDGAASETNTPYRVSCINNFIYLTFDRCYDVWQHVISNSFLWESSVHPAKHRES